MYLFSRPWKNGLDAARMTWRASTCSASSQARIASANSLQFLRLPNAALSSPWDRPILDNVFHAVIKTSARCWQNKAGVPTVLLRPSEVVESSLDIANKYIHKGKVVSVVVGVQSVELLLLIVASRSPRHQVISGCMK